MANLNPWQRLAAFTGLSLLVLTPLFVSPPAEAVPVATRSSASQGRASAASGAFTINKPTGTMVGDVMVASIGYRPCSSSSGGGCTTSITSPSGWTLVRLVEQQSGGGTGGYGLRLGIWYRVVTAADASVTNYRWNIGGAPSHNGAAGVIASFMHVDTTNPIVIDVGQTTASSRSHATPSIGVLATNTMLVSTHAALSSAAWTPPAGMTEILDWASQTAPSALGMSLEINTQQLTTPGVAGTRTATFTVPNPPDADAGATHILALRPIQADPTITMARSGSLVVGSSASYALTIGNKGPMPIGAANITVTNTLPTGLTYTSASGTGWSCSAAGQVVTCTYSGATLAKDGTLPLLTLNFNVVSGSVWTNTATVSSGADGDNDLTNSTVTDTWPTNTTTLATSSDPAASTIGPSALATDVNLFTLKTNSGTEPISSVTVNLSSPTGIDTLAITDNANNVLGSVAFPTTNGAITIPVIGMTATTTVTTYKVRVTPLVHVSMPAPPGGTYTITAPVTAWAGPAGHTGSDTNANALTIDNQSPNSATNTDATRIGSKFQLKWTTSSSSDFSTTSGSVVYRWASSTAGSEVPIEGSSPIKGEVNDTATVACVVTSAASTALTVTDGPGGSSSCTTSPLSPSQSFIYKVFQKDTKGNFDAGVILGGAASSTQPASFNCVEVGADASNGRLYTKLAGTDFNFDIVALKSDGTVETSYASDANKSVTVELVDGSGSTACASRSSRVIWPNQTFAAGNAGRISSTSATVSGAYENLRCRVTEGGVTGCSSDNFAIRPSTVTLSTTANALPPSASSSPAIKAGAAFSLSASTTPADYSGTLTLDTSKLTAQNPSQDGTAQSGGAVGTLSPATLTANASVSSNASYSEVGYLYLAAGAYRDDSFTLVDSATGDCVAGSQSVSLVGGKYGCSIGNASSVSLGRFIPDHFALSPGALTQGCGSFTYYGQDFSTDFILTARNSSNTTTQNYTGSLAKLGLNNWANFTFATTGASLAQGTNAPSGSWVSGTAAVSAAHRATRALTGAANAPADLSVTAQPVDSDGVTLSATAVSTPAAHRFGRLRMVNAYGSEYLALPVPLTAQYWNGSGFVTNTLDSCTSLTAPTQTYYTQNTNNQLASGETSATFNAPLAAGIGGLILSAPGNGNYGFLDITFSAPAWLQYNWDGIDQGTDGNLFDDNPRARATFGKRKGTDKVIIRREIY